MGKLESNFLFAIFQKTIHGTLIHGQTSTKYANLGFFRHQCATLMYIFAAPGQFFYTYMFHLGVAEELCRLFPTDNDIDMTPILRRSKDSARKQRSRPDSEKEQDVPHSRPLADRISIRPIQTHENSRKRPHNKIGGGGREPRDNFEPPRSKYRSHYPTEQPQRRDYTRDYDRRNDRTYDSRNKRLPSYEEYMRSATRGSNLPRSGRTYREDEDYMYDSRRSSRPSYERSVDEFLLRTADVRRHRR